jgi:hypothetical protein
MVRCNGIVRPCFLKEAALLEISLPRHLREASHEKNLLFWQDLLLYRFLARYAGLKIFRQNLTGSGSLSAIVLYMFSGHFLSIARLFDACTADFEFV